MAVGNVLAVGLIRSGNVGVVSETLWRNVVAMSHRQKKASEEAKKVRRRRDARAGRERK